MFSNEPESGSNMHNCFIPLGGTAASDINVVHALCESVEEGISEKSERMKSLFSSYSFLET